MKNENGSDWLVITANLLALQVIQDKKLVDAAWLLMRSGMKYSDIGKILGITQKSVSAHISNKRKQLNEEAKTNKKKQAKKAKDE